MTTFNQVDANQTYICPSTGDYSIELHGGSASHGTGGKVAGTIFLEAGTSVTFKVGGNGDGDTGGWPDGGDAGNGAAEKKSGAGSTSMWANGALIAVAGGGGGGSATGALADGGGESGGSGGTLPVEGGTSYGGGNGAPERPGITSAAGSGGKFAGGHGAEVVGGTVQYSSGGGGGFFGGGGGYAYYGGVWDPVWYTGSGGGSGWTGSLKSATNTTGGSTGSKAIITYVGPDPSGVVPGIPLTIRVRATTANCYVEKDIVVRVLGYCEHATFSIPALSEGVPVSYQLPLKAGTGFAPIVWSSTGTVPPGLSVSSTGLLSGTPTAAGTYYWVARTTDDSGAVATTNVTSVVS